MGRFLDPKTAPLETLIHEFPGISREILGILGISRNSRNFLEFFELGSPVGRFLDPKIAQDRFSLFLPSKRQKAPKTRFGRQSVVFCKNGCFLAPEVFILRPSRQPFCTQCFP